MTCNLGFMVLYLILYINPFLPSNPFTLTSVTAYRYRGLPVLGRTPEGQVDGYLCLQTTLWSMIDPSLSVFTSHGVNQGE